MFPERKKLALPIRVVCMIFGGYTVLGAIHSWVYEAHPQSFMIAGGIIVGAAWFGLGAYGGLPLVNTAPRSSQELGSEALTERERRGLVVLRNRKWLAWLSLPAALAMGPLVAQLPPQYCGLGVLGVGVMVAILNLCHWLSRCPRCGYGFFALSKGRATFFCPYPGKKC